MILINNGVSNCIQSVVMAIDIIDEDINIDFMLYMWFFNNTFVIMYSDKKKLKCTCFFIIKVYLKFEMKIIKK